ncbi:MAG TPA: FAD-dependent oxidoreductase [Planctomycetes bacterium]|nr:FAD-dependent oxidoreductase [Planctomycetota bacterium]
MASATQHFENVIIGQGLAGSAVAWTLHWAGQSVLLLDKAEPDTASRVAAGLITPVTGKRLVVSAQYDQHLAAATSFYRRVETATGLTFFTEVEMLRLFEDEAGRAAFLERSDQAKLLQISPWEGELQAGHSVQHGIRMQQAGRLDTTSYLSATRSYFEGLGSYRQTELTDGEFQHVEEQAKGRRRTVEKNTGKTDRRTVITLATQSVTADRLIMCTGAATTKLFPEVPNNPARGDILTVRIPDYDRSEVVHRSIWIASEQSGIQTVGSTYDWNSTSKAPTEKGRQEILGKLGRIVAGPVEVLEQVAAVRPTMKDYEPVLGRHPKWANVFILNGLGSKGTLKAPMLAKKLMGCMTGAIKVDIEQSYDRLLAKKTTLQRPLTTLAQHAVSEVLKRGETAIDATVGNGFDTSFLAETVGVAGRVIGFDVQHCAIESTTRRLNAGGFANVELKQQSHAELKTAVAVETVSAVMFNLGFLPRSDKTIVTKAASSTQAIAAALEVLKPHGILTILAYRGHEGGLAEYEAVHCLLQAHGEQYDLQRIDSLPARQTSPVLFILRKTETNE